MANSKLNAVKSPFSTAEKPTPYEGVTNYNNFYEFGTAKSDPAHNAKNFRTLPWTVSIEGAVAKPQVLDLDSLLIKVARSKNESTVIAAWKHGRSSCLGSGFR